MQLLMQDSFRTRNAVLSRDTQERLIIRIRLWSKQKQILTNMESKLFYVKMSVQHTKKVFMKSRVVLYAVLFLMRI